MRAESLLPVVALLLAGCAPRANPAAASASPLRPANLHFRWVKEFENGRWRHNPERDSRGNDTGYETITSPDGKAISQEELNRRVFNNDRTLVISGRELDPNCRAITVGKGRNEITFSFRPEGRRILEQFTGGRINKPIALFIDRKLVAAPTINAAIPGEGVIVGSFTAEQAKTLAERLNAGAGP